MGKHPILDDIELLLLCCLIALIESYFLQKHVPNEYNVKPRSSFLQRKGRVCEHVSQPSRTARPQAALTCGAPLTMETILYMAGCSTEGRQRMVI